MSSPDSPGEVVLRTFASRADYDQGVVLQKETWGHDFTECVPASILQISQKVGGVAAGAFDKDDRLIGFIYGLSGLREGRPAHWSHMLAVRPEYRGTGIGTKLKKMQRDLLLAAGIDVAYWTFDPLVSGNAHFNINLLGARPVEVVDVIDRWLAPDHRYFRVGGDDGAVYILRHDVGSERWELTMFDRRKGAP